jgi:uncharacterized membrane protein YphA (DoxX/SURF4 family)
MAAFAVDVANYRLLPAALVPWAASALVGVEGAVGVALLLGLWERPAALVASGLMVVFIVALVQAMARGISLDCGCFGGSERVTWWTVLRDGAMLVPAAALALRSGPAAGPGSTGGEGSPAPR